MRKYLTIFLFVIIIAGCRNQPIQTPQATDNKPSDLKVEFKVPRKRYAGNNIPYKITLINTGKKPAESVKVEMSFPENIKIVSIEDDGKQEKNTIVWETDKIPSGDSLTLNAKLTAKKTMKLKTRIIVTEKNKVLEEKTFVTEIAGPMLLVSLEDTNDPTKVGDEEIYKVKVYQVSGPLATNIRLECILDDSMKFIKSEGPTKGKQVGNKVIFEPLPKMAPGRTLEWKIFIQAIKEIDLVRFRVEISCYENSWTIKENESSKFIPVPEATDKKSSGLKVELKVPKKRFTGNIIPVTVFLTSNGKKPVETVNVTMPIPAEVKVASLEDGGKQSGNKIIWQIPQILPEKTVRLQARLTTEKVMKLKTGITVSANGRTPVVLNRETEIVGHPPLLISVDDTNDPVKVGKEEIYRIKIAFSSGPLASNVRLECVLDDSMEYIKSEGLTKGSLEGNKVVFEPYPKLKPAIDPRWKVYVKAVKANKRAKFTARLFYDKPAGFVEESEYTDFYE